MRVTILFFLLIIFKDYGQPPVTEWQNTYGGSLRESLGTVAPTAEGGYIMAGTTNSNDGDVSGNHGNGDVWVVKLNAAGGITWQKTLGGSQGEFGRQVIQTADGGYLITGMSSSNDGDVSGNHGGSDGWIVKLSSSGNLEWQKTFGGSGFDEIYSVKQTTDGDYVFLGWTQSNNGDVSFNHSGDWDLWVVKVSLTGDIIWQRTYGGTYSELPFEISQTTDSGFIVAAATQSADGDITNFHGIPGENIFDVWILKLDASGSIEWQKCYGGTGSEVTSSIKQTSDGGYILAAEPDSSDGDISQPPQLTDLWTVKLNSTGVIEWQTMHGGSNFELLPIIRPLPSSGYIALSQTQSTDGNITENHGDCDIWLTRFDQSGGLIWQKTFGDQFCDYPQAIEVTPDGGYVIGGELSLTPEGEGDKNIIIAKVAAESLYLGDIQSNNLVIYPNPAQNKITIQLSQGRGCDRVIFRDSLGKIVAVSDFNIIDISDLLSGLYTIEIQSGDHIFFTKFIKN